MTDSCYMWRRDGAMMRRLASDLDAIEDAAASGRERPR
jgi:hypothetical protein